MRLFGNPTLRLFIGAALISLSPVWVKLVDVSPTTSAFWRLAIGGVVVALYLVVMRQRLLLSLRIWAVLILAAAFLATDLWFYHRSIQYIGPGLSTLLANFQVFVMAAAGFVILRQPPTARQLLAIPLALFGLALIVGVDWGSLPENYRRARHRLRPWRSSNLRRVSARDASFPTGLDDARSYTRNSDYFARRCRDAWRNSDGRGSLAPDFLGQ